jgi:AraC-like DNA-binding protein
MCQNCEQVFASMTKTRYGGGIMQPSDFPLAVVSRVCDGPAALREDLLDRGLDLATIARLVRCGPRTLARLTNTGSSPRGVLVGLATLATVLDRLEERGIGLHDLTRTVDADPEAAAVIGALADESPLAARMIEGLRTVPPPDGGAVQLRLDTSGRRAA